VTALSTSRTQYPTPKSTGSEVHNPLARAGALVGGGQSWLRPRFTGCRPGAWGGGGAFASEVARNGASPASALHIIPRRDLHKHDVPPREASSHPGHQLWEVPSHPTSCTSAGYTPLRRLCQSPPKIKGLEDRDSLPNKSWRAPSAVCREYPHLPLSLLKLTIWVRGTNPPTLEWESIRVHQIGEPE